MALKGRERLDVLTRTWTEEAASELIEQYLQEEKSWGGDALLFVMLSERDSAPAETTDSVTEDGIQKAAFYLQQGVKRTDIVARVGADCFLVFFLGCHDSDEVAAILGGVCQEWQRHIGAAMTAGGVIARSAGRTYKNMRAMAGAAMERAVNGREKICILEEEGMAAGSAYTPLPVPRYVPDTRHADMDFIRELMNDYCTGKTDISMEKGLEKISRYFGCGQIYIVEGKSGRKGYEITYEWSENDPAVHNHNLRTIPALIGDRYMKLFYGIDFLVCNRVRELEVLDSIAAERQKIRGTRALMQCAVLEAGEYIGYVSLIDREKERIWSQREIMTFFLAGRILTSYILQLRSQRFTRILLDHDILTEAWNYNRFLAEGMNRLKNSARLQAVVTMDIKNFKIINADYSYEKGNEILVHISSLLTRFMGGEECFARIEADKFIMLLEYQTIDGLQRRLDQLIRRVEEIPQEKNLDFGISCMMGICLVEPGDIDMSVLADHANMARKALKDFHRSTYQFYNRKDEQRFIREREMTVRMKRALENEEFVVYYQPKVDLVGKACIGFEALVRWKTADGQLIPPFDFIPLFEKNGFIVELDRYVFAHVCALIRSWLDKGRTPYPIAVNMSRVHINQPEFLEKLDNISKEYGVPSQYLELEITESAFLHNPEVILDVARRIKERGFILSMDDFGTGYSSLSLLKDLPVDIIKLDREFFQKLSSDREKIIIANVIHMARQLDIQVISEGIETEEHEEFLKEIGCKLAQGYRYGKPAPMETYEQFLWMKER